ncbi:type II toxin-antitoxin system prevent-host-death family antitoxin [Enterococcus durans]|uniref:type II toxin-antitoxin system prevent-host-death family antitoxin n=1 Tax=Enterococcus durans TaxID=53345 RepID=UPI003D6ACDDF
MINIKPVSELRDYNKLLKEVKPDNPLFLTKNGHGMFAVIDLEEYEKFVNGLKILEQLQKAEEGPFYDLEDVMDELGLE